MKIATHCRDLGITLQLAGRRQTGLARSRLAAGTARLKRIAKLAQVSKRARRLAVPAGLSKACWGQAASGMTPSSIDRLRTVLAAATGINSPGRCRTTAIVLGYGLRQDPKVRALRDVVSMWLELWKFSDPK